MNTKLFCSVVILFLVLFTFSCKKEEIKVKSDSDKIGSDFLESAILLKYPESSDNTINSLVKPYIKLKYPITLNEHFANSFLVNSVRTKIILESIVSKNKRDTIKPEYYNSKDSLVICGVDLWYDGSHEFDLNFKSYTQSSDSYDWVENDTKTVNIKYNTKLLEKDIVANVWPTNNSKGISVEAKPVINFNYPVNKQIIINNVKMTIKVDNVKFLCKDEEIKFETRYSQDNTKLEFVALENMENENFYTVKYDLVYEVEGTDEGYRFNENKTISFATLDPKGLTSDYIEYSYPIKRQYHFLSEEYPKGYIKFKKYPENLNTTNINDNTIVAEFSNIDGATLTKSVTISNDSLYWEYDIPSEWLENEKVYKLTFKQVFSSSNKTDIIEYFFRTSMFNTFKDKINSGSNRRWRNPFFDLTIGNCTFMSVSDLGASFESEEALDFFESRNGWNGITQYATGLIRIENNCFENNEWYEESGKILYDIIKNKPEGFKGRDTSIIGVPPLRTTYINMDDPRREFLSDEQCNTYLAPKIDGNGYPERFDLISKLDYIILYDYVYNDLRTEIMSYKVKLHFGEYPIKIYYTLPGIFTRTSTIDFSLKY